MKAKRFLALLMCTLLCATAFLVSCGESEEESSVASEVSRGGANIEDYVDMPEFKWKGMEGYDTINICIYSDETQKTYFCEDIVPGLYGTTDQVLTDAVSKRNNEIEEKYGVTINAIPVADVSKELDLDITAQTGLYDTALPFMRNATVLAQENKLLDLRDFSEYIHFDQPWWDQKANEALSIGNKLYFTTGDISIMPKIVSIAVTFNKEMLKKNFPETDLYQMVRDGQWTFDKMMEMSKTVTGDTDGSTGMTEKDTWGLSSSYSDAVAFYIGSGNKMIEKDADDLPIVAIDNTASVTIAQKILEALQLKDEWCWHADFIQDNATRWVISLDTFGNNTALFRTSAFSAIKKLRAYADAQEFGIVPLPRVSDTQDSYYTYCNTAYAYCAVIPASLSQDRANFVAYMLDVMAFGGMKYITPAYYETTLKYRDLRDADSEEMLDKYIFNNIVYDLGNVYDFGGVQSMITDLMKANSNGIVSAIEEKKDGIELAIEECLDVYGIS